VEGSVPLFVQSLARGTRLSFGLFVIFMLFRSRFFAFMGRSFVDVELTRFVASLRSVFVCTVLVSLFPFFCVGLACRSSSFLWWPRSAPWSPRPSELSTLIKRPQWRTRIPWDRLSRSATFLGDPEHLSVQICRLSFRIPLCQRLSAPRYSAQTPGPFGCPIRLLCFLAPSRARGLP